MGVTVINRNITKVITDTDCGFNFTRSELTIEDSFTFTCVPTTFAVYPDIHSKYVYIQNVTKLTKSNSCIILNDNITFDCEDSEIYFEDVCGVICIFITNINIRISKYPYIYQLNDDIGYLKLNNKDIFRKIKTSGFMSFRRDFENIRTNEGISVDDFIYFKNDIYQITDINGFNDPKFTINYYMSDRTANISLSIDVLCNKDIIFNSNDIVITENNIIGKSHYSNFKLKIDIYYKEFKSILEDDIFSIDLNSLNIINDFPNKRVYIILDKCKYYINDYIANIVIRRVGSKK